jgi:hypothetical protein
VSASVSERVSMCVCVCVCVCVCLLACAYLYMRTTREEVRYHAHCVRLSVKEEDSYMSYEEEDTREEVRYYAHCVR